MRRPGPLLTFADVPGPIHPDDDMKRPEDVDAAHYASVGRSAVASLDMPCGYGRVLRLLAQEIPGERITACDINRQAIGFCASQFGATPLRSTPNLDSLPAQRYDLIGCGSLLTHIDERRVEQLVRRFAGALVPGGIAIVTIHAEPPASGPYASIGTQIDSALRERGHFHVSYENALFDYGHVWHTTQYVCEAFAAASDGAVQRVSHAPRGWDDHQDVLAFVREA